MRLSRYLGYMGRESRGSRGRLVFFVACLAIGVAAVVAVAGLTGGLERGIREEARQLLAADLTVESRRPIPEAVLELLDERASERAEARELVTVLVVHDADGMPRASQLVELKAVRGGYPFYGELELEPDRRLDELLAPDAVVVAPDLLLRLGVGIGDELSIGGEAFTISGVVHSEPDRLGAAFAAGPRVLLSIAALERTDLERFGSRVLHRQLVKMAAAVTDQELRGLADELATLETDEIRFRVETYREAQPMMRRGLQRVDRFLGLVALLSLLVGGVGVAQTTRAWLGGRMDAMAILRSIGFRPREVFWLYLGQTASLGLAGSLLGVLGGLGVQRAAPLLLVDLLPPGITLEFWQPAAIWRGVALGVGIALLFSCGPLLAILRVPPLRVLRQELEPVAPSRFARTAIGLALVGGVFAAAAIQARSATLGLQFTLALALATGLLFLVAAGVVALVARLPRRRGKLWLRLGLAALARPGAATLGAIVALGLGVLLLLGMTVVERRLSAELDPGLVAEAPSAFLIDIQPEQWPGVRRLLEERGAVDLTSVPVVSARLVEVEGRGSRELAEGRLQEDDRRWALRREQRLTYLDELPEDNEVVAGALWSDPERAEVSVEEEFAGDLGVGVGDVLTFDVQGVRLELTVTSLRTVDWGTFGINFFLVVEPGVLEAAPQHRIATLRLPAASGEETRTELAASYPNVTLFQIRQVLDRVRGVLGRLATGVRYLGGFTVLAGIVILAGAVSASTVRRAREVALFKTLGMTRRGVAAMFFAEYALIGLVAGALGTAGGLLLARAVLTRGMELAWSPDPQAAALAIVGSTLLTALTGILASADALNRRPAAVLRRD